MADQRNILVVDDEASILEIVCKGLSHYGFHPLACGNPAEALDKARRHAIPYALLDFELGWPEMNGIDLGLELKQIDPSCTIILMTGYHNVSPVLGASRKHHFSHLLKPFRIEQVISQIESAEHEKKLLSRIAELEQQLAVLTAENDRLLGRPVPAGLDFPVR